MAGTPKTRAKSWLSSTYAYGPWLFWHKFMMLLGVFKPFFWPSLSAEGGKGGRAFESCLTTYCEWTNHVSGYATNKSKWEGGGEEVPTDAKPRTTHTSLDMSYRLTRARVKYFLPLQRSLEP